MTRKLVLLLTFVVLLAPALRAQDSVQVRSLDTARDLLQQAAQGKMHATLPTELLLGDEPMPLPRVACVLGETACGRSETGFLEPGDCGVDSDDPAVDFYEFLGFEGTTIVIDMQSADFDTFLFLLDAQGNVLASNDDIDFPNNNLNSRIVFDIVEDDVYVIAATSAFVGEEGAYGLDLRCTAEATPGPCVPGPGVLCLTGDRFAVANVWATSSDSGFAGVGEITPDTGYLWFFEPNNVEAVVKVLNACVAPFDRYWVFAGGLTNVLNLTQVVDTDTGDVNFYLNNQDTPYQPIQDTDAFATCP